ncbi:MAG: Secretion system C-terminal sorting domain [Bacteroidota bacterium]|jgi:hypothetical protein
MGKIKIFAGSDKFCNVRPLRGTAAFKGSRDTAAYPVLSNAEITKVSKDLNTIYNQVGPNLYTYFYNDTVNIISMYNGILEKQIRLNKNFNIHNIAQLISNEYVITGTVQKGFQYNGESVYEYVYKSPMVVIVDSQFIIKNIIIADINENVTINHVASNLINKIYFSYTTIDSVFIDTSTKEVKNCSSLSSITLPESLGTLKTSYKNEKDGLQILSIDTSITDAKEEITVYPNPFTNEFSIYTNQPSDNEIEVIISNLQGQSIFQKRIILRDKNEHYTIDESKNWLPGIYFIKIRGNANFNKKIVKQY